MFCPNCGQENPAGAKTCETCGADLTRVTVEQPDSQPLIQADSAVRPDMKYAGFWIRFVAFIIDYVLLSAVIIGIAILLGISFRDFSPEESISTILGFQLAVYVVRWLYFALMESSSKQATLGKMVLRIIVTDEAGKRISFGRATGRNLAKIISEYIIYIGYIMIAFMKKKQGLHDLLASTLVIKK